MKKLIVFLLTFVITNMVYFSNVPNAFAATTVTSFSTNTNSVPKFSKFEATFQISRTFPANSFLPYYYYDSSDTPASDPNRTSPYGVDGITIDGHFTSPSGKEQIVPAFYYQQYSRSGSTMTPGTIYSWKLRYAPQEIGNYQYYITIQDSSGSSRYPASGTQTFSTTTSNAKGFIKVSIS